MDQFPNSMLIKIWELEFGRKKCVNYDSAFFFLFTGAQDDIF